ncbi:hypothetical protein [Algoriphagus sp.]|uniref:hypothetical protein n=1 Tax=Algoriphagus sp. TaxID=1872435 RepID=UPI00326C6E3D
MSDKLALPSVQFSQTTAITRSLLGVVLSLLIATAAGLLTPQTAPIFAVFLLSPGSKALGIKKSLGAVAVLFFLGLGGVLLGSMIQDFMVESILIVGLIIFWSLRLVSIPEPIRLMFLIYSILFPLLSLTFELLAPFVFMEILMNLGIALIVAQLAFILLPESSPMSLPATSQQQGSSTFNLDKIALNGLIVIFPVVILFFFYRPNNLILTLIYIVMLGMDPLIYKSKKVFVILLANLFGGIVAVVAYNLLTISPTFFFYSIVLLAASAFFTFNMYSDKKTRDMYPMAYRTFFVVMGVVSSTTDQVEGKLVDRLLGIILAVVYVVLAYHVLNIFNNPRINEKV